VYEVLGKEVIGFQFVSEPEEVSQVQSVRDVFSSSEVSLGQVLIR
jgi:hypothetical protein